MGNWGEGALITRRCHPHSSQRLFAQASLPLAQATLELAKAYAGQALWPQVATHAARGLALVQVSRRFQRSTFLFLLLLVFFLALFLVLSLFLLFFFLLLLLLLLLFLIFIRRLLILCLQFMMALSF